MWRFVQPGGDEDELVCDEEDTRSSREGLMSIVRHFLKRLQQEDLAERLQRSECLCNVLLLECVCSLELFEPVQRLPPCASANSNPT